MVGTAGEIYVLQGHGKAQSCVHKFGADGNYIETWDRQGSGPGDFDLPHSLVFDDEGLLYIADRNNARIQVFDADGRYIRESKHPGTPCGLCMGPDQHIWLAHGHVGEIMKLDLNGNVVGKIEGAGQGKTLGKYGEAHYIAVSPRDEIFVADTLNWRVQNTYGRSHSGRMWRGYAGPIRLRRNPGSRPYEPSLQPIPPRPADGRGRHRRDRRHLEAQCAVPHRRASRAFL
jgi:hypothetical protein